MDKLTGCIGSTSIFIVWHQFRNNINVQKPLRHNNGSAHQDIYRLQITDYCDCTALNTINEGNTHIRYCSILMRKTICIIFSRNLYSDIIIGSNIIDLM